MYLLDLMNIDAGRIVMAMDALLIDAEKSAYTRIR
jgi:hypothetical protein